MVALTITIYFYYNI